MCIAGAIVGAAVLGAAGSAYAADKSSSAVSDAANQSNNTQWNMYNQSRSDQAPYRQVGGEALNALAQAQGLTPYGSGGGGYGGGMQGYDSSSGYRLGPGGSIMRGIPGGSMQGGGMSGGAHGAPQGGFGGFMASPGYNFVRSEGQRGIEQSAAARGGAFSGNALRGLSEYNSGLASQEYGNWYNRMASLAGIGQTSTNQLGQLGQGYASNIGNGLMAAGNARASGIMGAYNGVAGNINSGINNYMLNQYMSNLAGANAAAASGGWAGGAGGVPG